MSARIVACLVAVVLVVAACESKPAEPAGVPVGEHEVFVGNYDTGNLSQWATLQARDWSQFPGNYCTYSACVKDDGADHTTAARYEVRDGDVPPFGGGPRAEVRTGDGPSAGGFVREGDERWYELQVKFDAGWKNPRNNNEGWFVIMQWFPGSGAPPLALQVSRDDTLDVGGGGVPRDFHRPIGPVKPGVWVDYVLHVRFSKDPAVGFVEVWQDGNLAVHKYSRPTMTSPTSYLKQGIYRDPSATGTQVVWHDGLRVTAP